MEPCCLRKKDNHRAKRKITMSEVNLLFINLFSAVSCLKRTVTLLELLDGYDLCGLLVSTFEYDSVCAYTDNVFIRL
jgi:hypothetical protein